MLSETFSLPGKKKKKKKKTLYVLETKIYAHFMALYMDFVMKTIFNNKPNLKPLNNLQQSQQTSVQFPPNFNSRRRAWFPNC